MYTPYAYVYVHISPGYAKNHSCQRGLVSKELLVSPPVRGRRRLCGRAVCTCYVHVVYVNMYVYVYLYLHVHVCACVNTYIYIYIYIRVCESCHKMHVYLYVYLCLYVYPCLYLHRYWHRYQYVHVYAREESCVLRCHSVVYGHM